MDHQTQIKERIKYRLADWHNLSNNDILLERMTGITNETYKATAVGTDLPSIIYRKFGESTQSIYCNNTDVFLERESEIYVYSHISEVGLGPQIYYFDKDIRIEQFINSTVLPANKMLQPGHFQEVAYTLAKYHSMQPISQSIKYQSLFKRVFIDNSQRILSTCHAKMSKDIFTPKEKQVIDLFKQWITPNEIQFLKYITSKIQSQPLVFSHNDLLANNVLIKQGSNKFVFIDYEYSCYNYPIYDIANYFNETQYDYDAEVICFDLVEKKPEKEQKKIRFIEAYVVAKHNSYEEFKMNFQILRKEEKYIQERDQLLKQLPLGELLSHMMWGWWAVIVCKNPKINFDYLTFAKNRHDYYQGIKKQLLSENDK